ncbi:unnamed protein product [Rotaria sp. Silwood2]|nr:unnamed protein product [Rotaria sp. Silwood2]CAF4224072.1 unnamed protein product [Rotaria sp. Silwood2]
MGPLHGIPISFKDQFHIKGVETAMGYVGYLREILEYNSILVDCVLSLGGVVYVKTTVPQTRMLVETHSGQGSLIALKGNICGFGTDLGGRVRFSVAVNGIYVLRPSDGRIPYRLARNSLDGQESVPSVVGPITRSLENIRTIFKAIAETKPWLADPKVHNIPWREDMFQEFQVGKLCFGVIRFDGLVHLSPPVQRAINVAVAVLRKAGHEVVEWDTSDHLEVNNEFNVL